MATTTPTTTGATSTTTGSTQGTTSTPLPSVTPIVTDTTPYTPYPSPTDTTPYPSPTVTPSGTPDSTSPNGGTNDAGFSFSSNNAGVASVDKNGVITAVCNGETTINVSYPKLGSKQVTVKVMTYLTSLSLSGSSNISVGSKTAMTVSYNPSNTSSYYKAVQWTSSDNTVATVDGNGNVTGIKSGSAIITCKAVNGTAYSKTHSITVNKYTNTVTINGGSNISKTYGAAAFNVTTTATNGTPSITSSNQSVATVSGNTVTIKGAGETTLTASVAANTTYNAGSASIKLTVGKATNTVTINGGSNISKTYGAAAFTVGTTAINGTPSITSSKTSVATVSGNKVTITGTGETTLTANVAESTNYNAGSASIKLIVNSASSTLNVSYFNGSQSTKEVKLSYYDGIGTYQLSVTNSNNLQLTYVSDNSSVASITNKGVVSIVGIGTANVGAYFEGNSYYNAASDYVKFIVSKGTPTLSISGGNSVYANSTLQLTKGGEKGLTSWDSNNKNIATVSSVGLVTGISYGEATITLTSGATDYYNAASTTKKIKVERNNQTVSMSVGSLILAYGESKQLSVTSKTTPTWSSSNNAYASVNSSGKVTGLYPSEVTITASAPESGVYNSGSATCFVTVTKANTSIKLKNAVGTEVDTITLTYNPTATYYQLTYYISDTVTNPQWSSSNPSVAYFDTTYYGMLYLGNAGSTTLKAYWDGNAYYHSAADTITLTISKASNTVTINGGSDISKKYGDAAFTVSRSATSGTPTITSSNQSVATVSGNKVTITGVGETTLTASVATSTNYNAGSKSIKLTVGRGTNTVTINGGTAISKKYGAAAFNVTTTATNGTPSITSSNTNVATVSGNTVTIKGVGETNLTAAVAASTNYNAGSATIKLTVTQADNTVTINNGSAIIKTYGAAAFNVSTTATFGTPSITSSNTTVATVSGNKVTIKGTGSTQLTATVAGTTNYKGASASITLTVKAASSPGSPNVPSNPDPVVPGGSSGPSGSSTPSASPTETPTPSSSPGEGGQWIDIDGQRYYSSGTHSTNASGGPESVTITCSSDVTYEKVKSWEGNFYYVIVKSKNSGQEIFRVTLGDTYMTSEAPTASATASATPTQAPTQASTKAATQAATQGATQGGTSKVS